MILNVVLLFSLLIVFFGNRARGGGLDLLSKEAAFTTLNLLRKLGAIYLYLFLVHRIKILFGCIICV